MDPRRCYRCGEEYQPKNNRQKYCIECRPVIKKERDQKKYQENREQRLERMHMYYQENREQRLERMHMYYQENREQILDRRHKYYQENKEKHKKYYQEHKEHIREYQRKYYLLKGKEKYSPPCSSHCFECVHEDCIY